MKALKGLADNKALREAVIDAAIKHDPDNKFKDAMSKIGIDVKNEGDVAALWADPSRAESLLGWRAKHGIDRMCDDTWRWQSRNPHGYA